MASRSRGSNSEPTSDHDNKYDCHLSNKYTDFIGDNIESFKSICKDFTTCIDDLLTQHSPFAVISGEDISLKPICGLIHLDESNTYNIEDEKCTSRERNYIKEEIESRLNDKIKDQQSWRRVRNCLQNSYGDNERSTYVNDICGLVYKQDYICKKRELHKQVQSFFNEEIHNLRCKCENLNAQDDSSSVPLGAVIGGVIGGLALLVLSVLLAIFCYKYRRVAKKKSSPNVIYLPAPNSENYPVYQEVFDEPYDPRYHPNPPSNPPTLPHRYNPNEEPAYLEPVVPGSSLYRPKALPPLVKTVNNPSYGDPPEYREIEETPPITSADENENPYLEPLPDSPEENESYDTLLNNEEQNSDEQNSYQPFNSFKSDTSGPVPAAKTQKDEGQPETTYFELEKVEDENKHTTV